MVDSTSFVAGELLNHVISTEAAKLLDIVDRQTPPSPGVWAVDGAGNKLTYDDGRLIDGERVTDLVARSGQQLTNAQAASIIRRGDRFVDNVWNCLERLRAGEAVGAKEEK